MASGKPKAPAIAYLATAGALVVLVAAVALNASPSSAPTIAEFAPQALEQIRQPPPDQSGREDGGNVFESPTATPTLGASASPTGPSPTPSGPIDRIKCYGKENEPKRQTDDPQSPPCRRWSGVDNGGATWPGVTRDEIRIAWPYNIEKTRDVDNLVRYFNLRYTFYGRQLKLYGFNARGGPFGSPEGVKPSDMRSDALFAKRQLNAFASLAYPPRKGAEHHYYDALAEQKVIGIDSHASTRVESHFAKHAPYEWGYLASFDLQMRIFGEFICRSLAGRPPKHGGTGIEGRTTPRIFGLVYQVPEDGTKHDRDTLLSSLKTGCNVVPAITTQYTTAEQTVLQLKSKDVTSIMCICQADMYFQMMPEATKAIYFPEWLVQSFQYQDYDSAGQRYQPEHATHTFGITFHNKWLSARQMPWYQAIKEVDPEYETGDDGYASAAYERYEELLVLASGIQMAGPNLTPRTFHEGLIKAGFPPPGSGTRPLFYMGGGYGPNDHTYGGDATMIWWSPDEQGYTANVRRGTFCYVDSGRRYGLGQWPANEQPFFEGNCK